MTHRYAGIDPGLSGACALINPDGSAILYDTPTFEVTGGKRRRREYDIKGMGQIIDDFLAGLETGDELRVALELVHAMPMNGSIGNFNLGRGLGLWEAILVDKRVAYEKVPPQRWRKLLLDGMPKGKGSSLLKAKQLFPQAELERAKDHGRAESLLLAEFLRRTT